VDSTRRRKLACLDKKENVRDEKELNKRME